VLTAAGIAAAAAMLGAAATLVFALSTGFDRTAARADLPDVTARFAQQQLPAVRARVETLANVRASAYRFETSSVDVQADGRSASGVVEGVMPGPRGYAVVHGRDLEQRGEIVVERGLARSWHLQLGDQLVLSGPAGTLRERVVGEAVAPDTIAYPQMQTPRLYTSIFDARRLAGAGDDVDVALIWVHDRSQLAVTLAQARSASYGVDGLLFVTRHGFEELLGRAAGIVIALLVAFSLVALGAAALMLAASAAGEVQRRREAIAVLRALGATPAQIANGYALEAAALAAPACALGLLGGWLAVSAPAGQLLSILNELMPGPAAMLGLLAACWLSVVALVAASTWTPAWRAARRPTVESLRGGDVVVTPRRLPLPALAGLGARLTLARPVRALALVAVLAASASVVLLILTIASVLTSLEENAQTLGTRYQLTVPVDQTSLARVKSVPGVAAVVPRYEVDAVDSFDLGESFRLIAFPGDISRFESPPLVDGRRVRTATEADVGLGLAQALDLQVGGTLAAQLPSGKEVRFRVVGIVEALRNEGLLAYVQPPRLRAAMADLTPDFAVKLLPGANLREVRRALSNHGVPSQRTGGISDQTGVAGSFGRASFLHVLATLLRSVAVLDGLVCLYALAQMLALIARERRRAVAVIRALGASPVQVLSVFAGAAVLVALLALPVGIAADRFFLGPEVAHLAISYVTLSLRAGLQPIGLVLTGLVVAISASAGWAARSAVADAIVTPLREE
jgi:ABC-type lipoprotein release transport system permease subunit